jgi:hypothetical protein
MTRIIRSRSGSPASGFPPLDPRLRRGTSLKASASPPLSLIREKPVKPTERKTPSLRVPRTPVVTRAEIAPCTCPEPCERDHENE